MKHRTPAFTEHLVWSKISQALQASVGPKVIQMDENIEKPTEPIKPEPASATGDMGHQTPIWLVVVLSIWIISTFVTFYYFLLAHRVVSYVVEG